MSQRPILDLAELEAELSRQAGTRVLLAYAPTETPPEGDNPLEPRHRFHLSGRRALSKLLQRMGEDSDTTFFRPPHPRYSLSHTPEGSYAVALENPEVGAPGLDVQAGHLSDGAARFFLHPQESQAASDCDLVRLWTVKEAVFKSNPGNAGTGIRDYVLHDAAALEGEASLPDEDRRFRYFCHRHGQGWVTLALSKAGTL